MTVSTPNTAMMTPDDDRDARAAGGGRRVSAGRPPAARARATSRPTQGRGPATARRHPPCCRARRRSPRAPRRAGSSSGLVSVRPRIEPYALVRPRVVVGVALGGTWALRIVRRPTTSSTQPPMSPSGRDSDTSRSEMALMPNAAMAPYAASAVATPNPEASPMAQPDPSVRRMTSSVMGPTAAAMVKPRTSPRRTSSLSTDLP